MNVNAFETEIGGYSRPSKPACLAYSLPAWACPTGSKLRDAEGTVCSKCYACKGHYARPGVKDALNRRLWAVRDALANPVKRAEFIGNFVTGLLKQHALTLRQIERNGKPGKIDGRYFRWHDAGDLQSVEHFALVCKIAWHTPEIKHKIPTKEHGFVRAYLMTGGEIPSNLAVLLSFPMIDKRPPEVFSRIAALDKQVGFAACHTEEPFEAFFKCPATEPGSDHSCTGCRKCWEPGTSVSYRAH